MGLFLFLVCFSGKSFLGAFDRIAERHEHGSINPFERTVFGVLGLELNQDGLVWESQGDQFGVDEHVEVVEVHFAPDGVGKDAWVGGFLGREVFAFDVVVVDGDQLGDLLDGLFGRRGRIEADDREERGSGALDLETHHLVVLDIFGQGPIVWVGNTESECSVDFWHGVLEG